MSSVDMEQQAKCGKGYSLGKCIYPVILWMLTILKASVASY